MSSPIIRLKKDLPLVYAAVEDQGWKLSVTRNGHIRFHAPDGGTVIGNVSHGPGNSIDHRSHKNLMGELQRAGLVIDKRPTPRHRNSNDLWSSGKVREYLGLRTKPDELAEYCEAGFLHEVEGQRGPGHFFARTEIQAFKESEEFKTLHVPMTRYKPRAGKEATSAAYADPALAEPITPIKHHVDVDALVRPTAADLKITVARHSMLAEELAKAMEPIIEQAVKKAIAEYVEPIRRALALSLV